MNIEIAEDTSYTFTYTKTDSGAVPGTITTATLRILGPTGSVYQASTAMTIASPNATKAINFATDPTDLTYSRDRNYQVEYTIDGSVYREFFDLVRVPFSNRVVDQDLINENRLMLDGVAEQSGVASSGTTLTLVDLGQSESDDHWNGGQITILPLTDTGVVIERLVTDYVKSTGTITFTPAATAVTTERYFIRRSYKAMTDAAADRVREDILSQGNPAYLLIDSTQVKRLIVLKTLESYFQQMRSAEGDKYDLQFKYYETEYKRQLAAIPLIIDIDDSGGIDSEEEKGQAFMSVAVSR